MRTPTINRCPGTLAAGFDTYSRTCLKRVFNGRKVSHILPFDSPEHDEEAHTAFEEGSLHASISGVQEKTSLILVKNRLRPTAAGERGTHILKPIPRSGKNREQMPANEHLTMQLARQVFGIDTAENALVFFRNGEPAYITKRFDVLEDGSKRAQDDLASLAGRTPQTQGADYKYQGNYLELFELLRTHLPAYPVESVKLFRLLLFNYLFSNGDAHLKNFSLVETPLGDYRLSPAYDLLNSRIHIADSDFALEEGLLPPRLTKGSMPGRFHLLANLAGIDQRLTASILEEITSRCDRVTALIEASFLRDRTKRDYHQAYLTRLKKLRG